VAEISRALDFSVGLAARFDLLGAGSACFVAWGRRACYVGSGLTRSMLHSRFHALHVHRFHDLFRIKDAGLRLLIYILLINKDILIFFGQYTICHSFYMLFNLKKAICW
jgi:hypothetical protein